MRRYSFLLIFLVFLLTFFSINVGAEDFFELCKNGEAEEIQAALEAGADVNSVNENGMTPLMMAAKYNNNPYVIILLANYGARINYSSSSGWTALMLAVKYNNNPYIVRTLINVGSNINAINKNGDSSLLLALDISSKEKSELLIEAGANVNIQNKDGMTPLMIVSRGFKSSYLIEELIDAGANPDVRDFQGWTPLMYATYSNNLMAVRNLLNAGSKIDLLNNKKQSALMIALKYKASYELIRTLTIHNAELNQRDQDGLTPIFYAVIYDNSQDLIELLIDAGAILNTTDNLGMTPLIYALKNEADREIIKFFINSGLNINKKDVNGNTAIMYAVKEINEPFIIEMILRSGADVNVSNTYEGTTPLMLAAKYSENEYIIELLLKYGAKITTRDNRGKRIVDYLEENKELKGTDIYWKLNYLEPDRGKKEYMDLKSKLTAGIWSAVLPSAGHVYTENWWPKGSLFLITEAGLMTAILVQDKDTTKSNLISVFALLKAWEIMDAIAETENYNDKIRIFNKKVAKFNKNIN